MVLMRSRTTKVTRVRLFPPSPTTTTPTTTRQKRDPEIDNQLVAGGRGEMEERGNPSFLSFSFPPSLGMRSSRCAAVVAPEGIGRMSEGGGRRKKWRFPPAGPSIPPFSISILIDGARRARRGEGCSSYVGFVWGRGALMKEPRHREIGRNPW